VAQVRVRSLDANLGYGTVRRFEFDLAIANPRRLSRCSRRRQFLPGLAPQTQGVRSHVVPQRGANLGHQAVRGTPVLAQPEMEKRRSPLVTIPPLRGGDFSRHRGLSSDDCFY